MKQYFDKEVLDATLYILTEIADTGIPREIHQKEAMALLFKLNKPTQEQRSDGALAPSGESDGH